MDSLYQRLKEMDPDTFQRFCFQLLKERHPGQELRHVEGASGDEGLDLFAGELSGKPVIWQCKAFPNGVGKSQKDQIRKSLRTALKHFSPSYWILCLSVDLDTKTSSWFENLKKSYESKVRIGKMFASDIVNELLHRRTLRNHFFPNASLDVIELKRLAARTGDMSAEELERVTDANLLSCQYGRATKRSTSSRETRHLSMRVLRDFPPSLRAPASRNTKRLSRPE